MEFQYRCLWIILYSSAAVLGKCPNTCKREKTTLTCHGMIPDDTCINYQGQLIDEVTVLETTFVERFNFSGKGWRNVKSLSLNPNTSAFHNKQDEVFKDLHPFEFVGLDNLEKLQISCRCLTFINRDAFAGLNKLQVLDLSNNENLLLNSIHNGLTGLTQLSELYLSNSSRFAQDRFRQLLPDFFRIIKNLPLKVFDISSTLAWALDTDNYVQEVIQEAFPFLEKLNLSDSSRLLVSITNMALVANGVANMTSYRRLKIFDLSNDFPSGITDAIVTSGLATHKHLVHHIPFELSELYLKREFKKPVKIPPVTANLTHLCFFLQPNKSDAQNCYTGNGENLRKLVAAENSIVYVDSNILNIFPNLKYFDISSNLLGDMIAGGWIQAILEKLLQLETLILSNNGIYTIPRDSFLTSMKLRHLDLSHNNMESITFNIYNLTLLAALDLRYNKITVLDGLSLDRLSYFLYLNESRYLDEEKAVRLFGNPFSCSCDDIHSLQWLVELNQESTCKRHFEGHKIDERLVEQVKVQCKMTFIIVVFCFFSLMVMISFGILVCYLKSEFKNFVLRKKIKEASRKYREMQNKQKYPVFLSFCCEDDRIVLSDIYPHLERGLQKVLQTNLPCVATGYSAFRPGYSLAEEIIRCIEASSIVVFFVTNQFCRKSWCRNETLVAHYENKPIILMIWEEIDLQFMPRYLYKHYKNHARVHWVLDKYGQRTMRPGWDELCGVIVSRLAENTNVL